MEGTKDSERLLIFPRVLTKRRRSRFFVSLDRRRDFPVVCTTELSSTSLAEDQFPQPLSSHLDLGSKLIDGLHGTALF